MTANLNEEMEIKKIKLDESTELVHCQHWVKRKKRFCKMTLMAGSYYCGEHKPVKKEIGQSDDKDERIICPLDSKHTVYKKKLKKHLQICNARPKDDEPPYVVKNINSGHAVECTDDLEKYMKIKLNDLEDKEFYSIIEKVKDLYGKYVDGNINTIDVQHKLLACELGNEEYSKETRKHLVQTAALIGVMENENQIQSNTNFIEFGAGKGQLAFYLARLLQEQKNSQLILLDRMSLRHKKDNKIEDRSLVHRIRVDIADFNMQGLDILKKAERNVAFSKHLCGGATDLTLRCITQKCKEKTSQEQENVTIDFIMIAVCCHHRCDWPSFIGKDFLQSHDIDARTFTIITKMVSWAICGTGMSRERRRMMDVDKNILPNTDDNKITQRVSLKERETIGFMCKRILDFARVQYLQQHGYEASLVYYVSRDITLENVCLLARRTVC